MFNYQNPYANKQYEKSDHFSNLPPEAESYANDISLIFFGHVPYQPLPGSICERLPF